MLRYYVYNNYIGEGKFNMATSDRPYTLKHLKGLRSRKRDKKHYQEFKTRDGNPALYICKDLIELMTSELVLQELVVIEEVKPKR